MTAMGDEALLYVVERRMTGAQRFIGTTVAILSAWSGQRGVCLSVDWPVFLGCTEDAIVEDITAYYRREADRMVQAALECPTGGSQSIGRTIQQFIASEDGHALLSSLAAKRWTQITGGDEGETGGAPRQAQEKTPRAHHGQPAGEETTK